MDSAQDIAAHLLDAGRDGIKIARSMDKVKKPAAQAAAPSTANAGQPGSFQYVLAG